MSNRKLVASADEKVKAGKMLKEIFFDGSDDEDIGLWLHDHLQKRLPGVEKILAADYGTGEILDEVLPLILVDMFGSELFEGSFGGDLRGKILDKLFDMQEYSKIFKIFLGSSSYSITTIDEMKVKFGNDQKELSRKCIHSLKCNRQKHPWRPGGTFARRFVAQIRLDDIFAGIRSEPKLGRIEEAVPKAELKDLKRFQENMKSQVLEILKGSEENRAIVTLPTGAGKTRTVVEAIVKFLNDNFVDRNILWIAQSQEVCEQAVLCFKQIWEHHGKGDTLSIYRAWGDNDIPTSDERGIIVGSTQKLASHKNELHHISDDDALSAVFIDEAHHSVAGSYVKILNGLGMSKFPNGIKSNDKIPLIGLTATPERRRDSETKRLLAMYGDKRIYPSEKFEPVSESNGIRFDKRWSNLNFMRKNLEELKFLAHAEYIPIDPGRKVLKLDESESKNLEDGGELWIEKIATEPERNENIKNEILKESREGRKILYFGTNVSQSNAMSRILEQNGFSSVCITGNTRYAARKLYVDTFNKTDSNSIQIMCNYNVLSTGFDSPQIDTVIIARPTTSIVSYQQMVGRGLRGEKFGGKPGNRCRIVTVRDNIKKFNDVAVELGYLKFEKDIKYIDQGV